MHMCMGPLRKLRMLLGVHSKLFVADLASGIFTGSGCHSGSLGGPNCARCGSLAPARCLWPASTPSSVRKHPHLHCIGTGSLLSKQASSMRCAREVRYRMHG